jgi:hypothetical protein
MSVLRWDLEAHDGEEPPDEDQYDLKGGTIRVYIGSIGATNTEMKGANTAGAAPFAGVASFAFLQTLTPLAVPSMNGRPKMAMKQQQPSRCSSTCR